MEDNYKYLEIISNFDSMNIGEIAGDEYYDNILYQSSEIYYDVDNEYLSSICVDLAKEFYDTNGDNLKNTQNFKDLTDDEIIIIVSYLTATAIKKQLASRKSANEAEYYSSQKEYSEKYSSKNQAFEHAYDKAFLDNFSNYDISLLDSIVNNYYNKSENISM